MHDYIRYEFRNSRLEISANQGRTRWKLTWLNANSPRAGNLVASDQSSAQKEFPDPMFFWGYYSTDVRANVPHWFYAFIAFALACLPWVVRRFSIRTMLVLMAMLAAICTLVAAL